MVRVVKLGNCMFNFVIIDLIANFVWTEIYVEYVCGDATRNVGWSKWSRSSLCESVTIILGQD